MSTHLCTIVTGSQNKRVKTLYDCELMSDYQFRHDRLEELMKKRGLNDGQLAYMAGMSKSMIFYLRSGERPNVSAVNAAKIAEALGCSVDYLLGLSDDPLPSRLELGEVGIELLTIAKTLPESRQRDLLLIAQAYQEAGEPTPEVMELLLDKIEELGGPEEYDRIMTALESLSATSRKTRRRRRTANQ